MDEFISKLKKFKKACDYMDSDASKEDKDKWQDRFNMMLIDVSEAFELVKDRVSAEELSKIYDEL